MNNSKIAMGAWAWGDKDGYFGNTMTIDEFRPIFQKALALGLNIWDTATAYSNGESEKILGTFVNEAGRDKVVVSTKFTPQMAAMYDNSVEKMCDASLVRMGLDDVDIYRNRLCDCKRNSPHSWHYQDISGRRSCKDSRNCIK